MANIRNHYSGQRVLEADLDTFYTALNEVEENTQIDNGLASAEGLATPSPARYGGIKSGLVVTKTGASTLQVTAGVCTDSSGRRVELPTNATVLTTVAGSTDEGDVTGAIGNGAVVAIVPGSEAWMALFLVFDDHLTDPRIDALGVTVYYNVAESFHFELVMGATQVIPATNQASLDDEKVLLAEVLLRGAGLIQTLVIDAVCETNEKFDLLGGAGAYAAMVGRRADWIACEDPGDYPLYDAGNINLRARTAREALSILIAQMQVTAGAVPGSGIIGAPAAAGALDYYPEVAEDLAAGSVTSQLLALLTALNKKLGRGGGMLRPHTAVGADYALLGFQSLRDATLVNFMKLGLKRGHCAIPHILFEDFMGIGGVAGVYTPNEMGQWAPALADNDGTVAFLKAEAGGVVRLTTAATTNSTQSLASGYLAAAALAGGWWNCGAAPYAICSFRFRVPAVITDMGIALGLAAIRDNDIGSTDAVFITYASGGPNAGKIMGGVLPSGGAAVYGQLAAALVLGRWYTGRIAVVSNVKAIFQLNDEVTGEIAEVPVTAAFALASSLYNAVGWVMETGGALRYLDIDQAFAADATLLAGM